MASAESKITTDHETIRHWVEDRGGWPSSVKGTPRKGEESGVLRIDFPGYSGRERLEKISWEEFFQKFEQANLAFLYQDEVKGGQTSRFFKLVKREAADRNRGARGGKDMADVFEIIESDHQEVLQHLDDMMETTGKAKKHREDLVESLKQALLPHMKAEESLFYKHLMKEGGDPQSVFEALEEHHVARHVFSELESMPVDHERWTAKAKVLSEIISHHIEEEETEIFESAHEIIDEDEARKMGAQFLSIEEETRARRKAA